MVKTKALISYAVTAKLISVFVFAYGKHWFSHEAAHLFLFFYLSLTSQLFLVCLKLNVPINKFSVMLGWIHCFLGITSTFGGGGKYVLLKDTTWRPELGSYPRPLDPESEVLTTRPPCPLSHLWKRVGFNVSVIVNHTFMLCVAYLMDKATRILKFSI